MNYNFKIKSVSIFFAFMSFVISLVLCGQLIGFEQALWIQANPGGVPSKIIISGLRVFPNFYEALVAEYIVIAICFLTYGAVKYLENYSRSKAVSLLPLGLIISTYCLMFLGKYNSSNETAMFGYGYWIINSLPFDWFCAITAAILLIAQIVIIYKSCRARRNIL